MAKIVASSLDNFVLVTSSTNNITPYVTFSFSGSVASNVTISIADANDTTGYSKRLVGTSGGDSTSTSWNTDGSSIYSFLECLRQNNIFYNITLQNSTTIKAYIDSSTKYTITSSSPTVAVGGNYSSYNPSKFTKSVIMLQGEIDGSEKNISMEKYHKERTVSFNITSPFSKMAHKQPIIMNISGYSMIDGTPSGFTLPFDSVMIMPTTIDKFGYVDYDEYTYTGTLGRPGDYKKFLTNNFNRYYNYDELIGLSVFATNLDYVTLKKDYYTTGGLLIASKHSNMLTERNGIKFDLYDNLEIDKVEMEVGKQVGYVKVAACAINQSRLTDYITYTVRPKCHSNNEIFFVNELGGIDSFNFVAEKVDSYQIDDLKTYNVNHTREFGDTYQWQMVANKKNKQVIRISTSQISKETALWLNELAKSKYTFKFLGLDTPNFKIVIIDKFDIEVSSNSDEFELSLEYHTSDKEVTL